MFTWGIVPFEKSNRLFNQPDIKQRGPRYEIATEAVGNISTHPWLPSLCMYMWDERQSNISKCENEVKVLVVQSCLTLLNPMDCSPSSSSDHGIFQVRTLEWVAIPRSVGYIRHTSIRMGFPCGSAANAGICNVRIHLQWGRPGFDPWVGKIPWRRERLSTPVFWPGEFHGLYSPRGHKESDSTERLSQYMHNGNARKKQKTYSKK